MHSPLRAVVVDDSPMMLKAAASLLGSLPGVEVVGEATSGQGALDAVARLRPDLVLLDLAMPEMNGLEVTRRLTARPDLPVIILLAVQN